jgi:hypothetical protein
MSLDEDGRIAAVGPGLTSFDADVIDARGTVVIPGIADTLRHMWATPCAAACLRAGSTSPSSISPACTSTPSPDHRKKGDLTMSDRDSTSTSTSTRSVR